MTSKPTRRRFLLNTGMLAAGWELSCADAVLTQELAPTPSCRDGDEPTVRQTEGPFFKPRSPERSDLREHGAGGRRFELSGFVLTRSCRLLHGAVVDVWHADEKGEYDNIGFRYRGHVITGPDGAFRFRTTASALLRPHEALSSQGSSAWQPSTDHATLFSKRAGEPP
jgi:protocatechuate 3,4-dioxygenase beta subunit